MNILFARASDYLSVIKEAGLGSVTLTEANGKVKISAQRKSKYGFHTFTGEDYSILVALHRLCEKIKPKPCEIGDIVSMEFYPDYNPKPSDRIVYPLVRITEIEGPRPYGCGWNIRGLLLADSYKNGRVECKADGRACTQDTNYENIRILAKANPNTQAA